MKVSIKNDLTTFLLRIGLLYIVYIICRVLFYLNNTSLIEPITSVDIWGIIKGGFIYDSASIFYANSLFMLFSLLPITQRSKEWYQKTLFWLFIIINAIVLSPNVTDIFYYEFKLSRIAAADLRYFGEDNAPNLFVGFIQDYWYGFLLYVSLIAALVWGYKKIKYHPTPKRGILRYYLVGTVILAICATSAITLIRGGNIKRGTSPISMSDATLFINNPTHSSVVLSNPFCIIRTLGKGNIRYTEYFAPEILDSIYPTTHKAISNNTLGIDSQTNIIILLLESFGSAHLGMLNGQGTNYSPFLDSLATQGVLFTNAYHNGIRSIDALPSIWGSIPTFKEPFLSLPQSTAATETLPTILNKLGYTTAFMHGGARESMSFVAFSKKNGVHQTYSLEEYEQERGTADHDGSWGIWDDKFVDYAADKIIEMPKPLFTTIFTLSSHSPFKLPKGYTGEVTEGTLPIHKTIRYTDGVLRDFFAKLSKEPFYENTLFIITADHSSGGDSEKFRKVPHSFSIPIIFYKPNSELKGENSKIAGHIDIMPTVVAALGYDEPYFGFGHDLFATDSINTPFTINYCNGAFNIVTDSTTYIFNEREIISTIGTQETDTTTLNRAKALIQQYYTHIKNLNFLPRK